jgi:hypothetical protein
MENTLGPFQEWLESFKEAIGQYEETRELITDTENEILK